MKRADFQPPRAGWGEGQPSISKAVAALEKRLGIALFNRSTRSVTLTDQGQRYYDRAKPLIDEMDDVDNEMTNSTLSVTGLVRISVASTFGRLHILPLIPGLLSLYPGLEIDLVLSDFVRDMVEDRIDLAIRLGSVDEGDAVARRVAGTPLVCVGSRRYFERRGMPTIPADLVDHNCLIYSGLRESANWPFVGPNGPFSVSVRGNLSSNSIETIRTGVLAGVGIGFFTKVSLADELAHPDVRHDSRCVREGRERREPRLAQAQVCADTRAARDGFFCKGYPGAPLGGGRKRACGTKQ